MSGHNKWSTIKHRKGAQDAKRGKVFTKIIKEITIAARDGGGDPEGNPRLRRAIDLAKSNNVPSENLERAIKKGTGELEGMSYEELMYEGVGPGGTLFLIEVMTDNRNRTAPEIRKIFEKHKGQLGSAGVAAWAFDERGQILVEKSAAQEEALFDVAVGAGAEDMSSSETHWVITTSRECLEDVRTALVAAEFQPTEAQLVQLPKTPKGVEGKEGALLMRLVDVLEDHDDVQRVHVDFEPSDALVEALSGHS